MDETNIDNLTKTAMSDAQCFLKTDAIQNKAETEWIPQLTSILGANQWKVQTLDLLKIRTNLITSAKRAIAPVTITNSSSMPQNRCLYICVHTAQSNY